MTRKVKPLLVRIAEIHIPKRDYPEHGFPPKSRAFDNLKRLLKKKGMAVPVFLNQDKLLLQGHFRLWAWKELGNKHVPAVLVEKWDEILTFFE